MKTSLLDVRHYGKPDGRVPFSLAIWNPPYQMTRAAPSAACTNTQTMGPGIQDRPATSSSPMRNVVLEVELGRVKRVVIDVGSIGDPVRNSGNSLLMRDDMDVTKMRKAYAATLVCLWMRGVGS